jgi:TctA family transporter
MTESNHESWTVKDELKLLTKNLREDASASLKSAKESLSFGLGTTLNGIGCMVDVLTGAGGIALSYIAIGIGKALEAEAKFFGNESILSGFNGDNAYVAIGKTLNEEAFNIMTGEKRIFSSQK